MSPPDQPPIQRITGTLTAILHDRDGIEVTRRHVHNTVLRSGAELIAGVLTGQAGAVALNAVAVGVDPTPASPPYVLTGLTTTSGDDTLAGPTVAALAPESFTVETQADRLRVRVGVRAVLPAGAATGIIREAALGTLSEDGQSLSTLYNRVIMEPIEKTSDQELALYWDIFFPYGT